MKYINCYNCNSDKYNFYAEENGYRLVQCKDCGLLFVENRPKEEDISEAHKQGKHSGTNELNVTGEFSWKKVDGYHKVLDDLFEGNLGNKKTWLDVGCGHGEFMIAIQKYCSNIISVKGTEPNVFKQESAIRKGLNVSYFDLNTHKDKYDVISLLNVYSHLPNPPIFIKSLKNLLNSNGELILQTGDTADLSASDHYRPFYLPDHLSFASEKIVLGILERLNFEIIKIKKYQYEQFDQFRIIKEIIKIFLPKHESRLGYYMKRNLYAKRDMYIRCRKID